MSTDFLLNHSLPSDTLANLVSERIKSFITECHSNTNFSDIVPHLNATNMPKATMLVHWERLYFTERRYKWELFIKWLTDEDLTWQNYTNFELIKFSAVLKQAFYRGTPGGMKEILLHCIPECYSDASLDVKQFADNYEKKAGILKEVQKVHKKFMQMLKFDSTFEEDDFINTNYVSIERYCTQLLSKRYFGEDVTDPDKFVIKEFNAPRKIIPSSRNVQTQHKNLYQKIKNSLAKSRKSRWRNRPQCQLG